MIKNRDIQLGSYLLLFFMLLQPALQSDQVNSKQKNKKGTWYPTEAVEELNTKVGPLLEKAEEVVAGLKIEKETNKKFQNAVDLVEQVMRKINGFVDGVVGIPPPARNQAPSSVEAQQAQLRGLKLLDQVERTIQLLQLVLRLSGLLIGLVLFSKIYRLGMHLLKQTYDALEKTWYAIYPFLLRWREKMYPDTPSLRPPTQEPLQEKEEEKKQRSKKSHKQQLPTPGN